MEKWPISAFLPDGSIREELIEDTMVKIASDILHGDKPFVSGDTVSSAVRIYTSTLQRSILSSLLISEDCDIEDMSKITGISEETIEAFSYLFFRVNFAFSSKIDKIDYIETGIRYFSDENDDESLNLFLLMRWTVSLGKEFVIWKYRLLPVEYSADRLYSVVMKEAFFYHKEKSMGNVDISLTEYLRSANTLLSSVKNSTTIKTTSEDDAGLEILDQLGIIVVEKEAPIITLDEISGVSFINNALTQETT